MLPAPSSVPFGVVGVALSGLSASGWDASSASGVVGAVCACAALGLSIGVNNNRKKKDAQAAISQAVARQKAEDDAEFNRASAEHAQRVQDLQRSHEREMSTMTADRDFYRELYFRATGKDH